ncbi:hypothetical protein BC830DRAFT_1169742 [Chytriomyces sp. MP71]|nr:hypothetical protein BC830DRAFT_1169742 [Chytriomyces sp. MP71]
MSDADDDLPYGDEAFDNYNPFSDKNAYDDASGEGGNRADEVAKPTRAIHLTASETQDEQESSEASDSESDYDAELFEKFMQGHTQSQSATSPYQPAGPIHPNPQESMSFSMNRSTVGTRETTDSRRQRASMVVGTSFIPLAVQKVQNMAAHGGSPRQYQMKHGIGIAADSGMALPEDITGSNNMLATPLSGSRENFLKPIPQAGPTHSTSGLTGFLHTRQKEPSNRSFSNFVAVASSHIFPAAHRSRTMIPQHAVSASSFRHIPGSGTTFTAQRSLSAASDNIIFGMGGGELTVSRSAAGALREGAVEGSVTSLSMLMMANGGGAAGGGTLALSRLRNAVTAEGPDAASTLHSSAEKQVGFDAGSKDQKMVQGTGTTGKDKDKRVFRQKEIFLQLSIIFGVCLLVIVVYDYACLLIYDFVPVTAQWLISLMFLQVAAIYLFILSLIYANEAGNLTRVRWSLLVGAINLIAFLLRVVLQLQFAGYEVAGVEDVQNK